MGRSTNTIAAGGKPEGHRSARDGPDRRGDRRKIDTRPIFTAVAKAPQAVSWLIAICTKSGEIAV